MATTRPWFCPQTDCPSGSHDTYSARRYGCTSPAAMEDARLYRKRWRSGLNQPKRVDTIGVKRRIEACHFMGWTGNDLARACDTTRQHLQDIRYGRWAQMQVSLRHRMVPVLEAMAMRQAPRDMPHNKARNWAAREGFRPLLAWDDIDDPSEAPAQLDLREQIAAQVRRGLTQERIADNLGVSPSTVVRHYRKLGEIEVEIDPHLWESVRGGSLRFAQLSYPERSVVVARAWSIKVGEGFDKPAEAVAGLLDIDPLTVQRIHNTATSRASRARQAEEAS